MKGVIYNINDEVNIVDVTHEVAPYGIREAAVLIGQNYEYFPLGTIHVCVVDPGVGSERRPVIVSNGSYLFVGPDNGLFTQVYSRSEKVEVFHVTSDEYFIKRESSTFHGRDVFAPVAAWLSRGKAVTEFGERIHDYVRIDIPEPERSGKDTLQGEILYFDHFGNAITNIRKREMENVIGLFDFSEISVQWRGKRIALKRFYAEVRDTDLHAVINSSGFLELFVNRRDASKEFGLRIGEKVIVSRYASL
jgi:S-adenosylmethionine hydrolase